MCDACLPIQRVKDEQRRAVARREIQHREQSRRASLHAELITLGGPKIFRVIEAAAERTQEETGKILNLSGEAVRLIEMEALIKLFKQYQKLQNLRDI